MKTLLGIAFAVFLLSTVISDFGMCADEPKKPLPDLAFKKEISANEEIKIDAIKDANLDEEFKVLEFQNPMNGEANLNNERKVFTYKPKQDYVGTDVIRYLAGESATDPNRQLVEVSINVTGIQDLFTGEQITAASILLFKVLILAIILELGLHRIFDNRWFIRFLEGRGVKTLIAVAAAYALIKPFEIDLASDLVGIFENKELAPRVWGQFLTALIVAGGSSTVFRLYRTIGLRPPYAGLGDTNIERREFGRVRFGVTPGTTPELGPGKTVEIFVGDELVKTIRLGKELTRTMRGVPIETGKHMFAAGISPAQKGDDRWERELSISSLRDMEVRFDLSKKPNAKF